MEGWGVGKLQTTEVIGNEKDQRGRRGMARRLLQPAEKTWAWTTATAAGLEEIDYATFVL